MAVHDIDTAVSPRARSLPWRIRVLAEIADAPRTAAVVWGLTLLACFGGLWSIRFPLNSGVDFAWSLHPKITGPPVFTPASSVAFTFGLLLAIAAAWAMTVVLAARGRITVTLAAAGAVVLPTLCLAPPAILSEDMASYWAYGRMVAVHGANPYVATPINFPDDPAFTRVAEVWWNIPSTYGPGFNWVAGGVAAVSGTSFATAVFLFKLVSLLGVLAVSVALVVVTRGRDPTERALRLVLWGWNPIVTLYLVGGGHNDALVAAGLAVGAIGAMGERPRLAFAGLAVAALMKPIVLAALAVYVVWLWLRRPDRRGVAVAGLLAALGTVALAYMPYWVGGAPLEPLRRIAMRRENATAVGWVVGPFHQLLGHDIADFLARTVTVALLGLAMLWMWRRSRTIDAPEALVVTFGAILMSSSYSQPWYLVWLLVPLCFAGRDALRRWWSPVTVLCTIWALKAVRNQSRYSTEDAFQLEGLLHWLQGAALLLLLALVVQSLLRTRRDVAFPELAEVTGQRLKAATTSASTAPSVGANPV